MSWLSASGYPCQPYSRLCVVRTSMSLQLTHSGVEAVSNSCHECHLPTIITEYHHHKSAKMTKFDGSWWSYILHDRRQFTLVEKGIKNFHADNLGTAVPQDLLRDLLSDAVSAKALEDSLILKGSRTCSGYLEGGYWLIAQCCGPFHNIPTVLALKHTPELDQLKVNLFKLVSMQSVV